MSFEEVSFEEELLEDEPEDEPEVDPDFSLDLMVTVFVIPPTLISKSPGGIDYVE